MKKSQKQILGIDISKASFHVALLDGSGKEKTAVFKNNSPGFRQLNEWLELNKVGLLHACMEATSRYYEALAEFLYEKGHHVSVVNPQRIKGFAQSELRRSKTDRIDASLIARFCEKHNPRSWSPLPSEIRELQEVERYLHSLKVIRLQEQNKLESRLTSKTVMTSIERHISEIDKQIKELEAWMNKHTREHSRLSEQRTLITSVIGIGDLTSYTWLGELGYMDSFNDANQLESFCGLNLRKKQSGTSITVERNCRKLVIDF
jgi:transposase